jgi:polar amino acid transport system substrate-binding protein
MKHNKIRNWFAGFLAAVSMAVPFLAQAESSLLDQIKERGVLKVVTLSTIPPFAFKDEKGELVGLDIDFARLIARELLGDPSKVEFVSVSGEGRWPAITSGSGDMGIATIYMSRANNVAFSRPLYDTGITLLVGKDSPIQSIEDVNKSGVSVANLNNPQMTARAKEYFPNATVQTFDQPSAEFLALRSKRVQAMQIDSPIADYFAAQNANEVRALNVTLGDILHNGIYSRLDDPKWQHWLDTFSQEITIGSLYPEYKKIYAKWFNKAPPAQRWYLQK